MLSAVIHSQHSYSAVLLAEQPIDQRFVHPGPLVVLPPLSRSTDYIFTRLHVGSEGDGILHIGAVIFKEMIPQPMRPRVFQRKSLRGQT